MPRLLLALSVVALSACAATRTGPEARPSTDPADRGRALLLAAADALGGRDAFAGVEAMAFDLDATLTTPQGTLEATSAIAVATPDRLHRVNVLGELGEITFTIVGDRVRFKPLQENALREASPEEAAYLRAGFYRELPLLLANASSGELDASVAYVGEERAEGGRYEVVEVVPPGGLPGYRLYLDAATGRPHKRAFEQGGAAVEDVFSDYRRVGSPRGTLTLPHRVLSYRGGELAEDIRYTRVELDADLDHAPFSFD